MTLDEEFKIIKEFEKKNRNMFLKGKPFYTFRSKNFVYGNKEHIKKLKEKFVNGRKEKESNETDIIPDFAVYEYIKTKYNLDDEKKETVKKHHNIAMDAENKMGHYLEEYIYNNIKSENWVWCTGDILRSIDFIKKTKNNKKEPWFALQVKNSDNSENSSSNKVRKGTKIKIKHWFRRFSKKNKTNWDKLVEITGCEKLSNENFLEFLRGKAKN